MRNEAGEWADPVALIPLFSGYMRVRIVSLNTYTYCPDNQRWLEKYLIYYSSVLCPSLSMHNEIGPSLQKSEMQGPP